MNSSRSGGRRAGLAPGLAQADDRGAFPVQQAMHPVPARRRIIQPPGGAAGLPAGRPHVVQAEQRTRPPRGPAALSGGVINEAEQASLVVAQTDPLRSCIEGADLTVPMPSCPGWNVGQLLRHLGGAQRWAEATVRTRATQPLPDEHFRDLSAYTDEGGAGMDPGPLGGPRSSTRAGLRTRRSSTGPTRPWLSVRSSPWTRRSPSTPSTSGWSSARGGIGRVMLGRSRSLCDERRVGCPADGTVGEDR